MFFPKKIKSISPNDKVLEIGPGSDPFWRSDIFLEKSFSPEEAYIQNGHTKGAKLNKKTVYYDGGQFPFKDQEFDYVICSHVIEHIPMAELESFISELQRVAKRGYLEFPNVFYELINYQPVHIWLMNLRDGKLLFLDKNLFKSSFIHLAYRDMIYTNDLISGQMFNSYKEFFFCGLEWEEKIDYEIIDNFDKLVNENDYIGYKKNLSITNMSRPVRDSLKAKISEHVKVLLGEKNVSRIKSLRAGINRFLDDDNPIVKKTAIINDKRLVKLGKRVEIGEQVIISTHQKEVEIGDYSQINPFTVIYGNSGVKIGKNVMIAPHCMIAAGNHDFKQTETPIRFAGNLSKGPIIIEDNVWIGANCTIADGVHIGHDAVVGANSLVNKDVEPYDIVGGVPAKGLSNRIDNEKYKK